MTWKVLGAVADGPGSTVYPKRLHTGQVLCDSELPCDRCAAHWLEISLGGSNSGSFVLCSVHQCQSCNAWFAASGQHLASQCYCWFTAWLVVTFCISTSWLHDPVLLCVPGHSARVPSIAQMVQVYQYPWFQIKCRLAFCSVPSGGYAAILQCTACFFTCH